MLLGISGGDDQKYARRALALLCFTPRPILLDELAEFVLMELDACPTLDTRNQFFDIEDLLEILTTGMVTPVRVSVTSAGEYRIRENAARVDSLSQIESTSSDDEELWSRQPVKQVVQVYMDEDKPSPPMFKYLVQFAHSSVKEYLMSQSISKGPASTYFLDRLPSEVYIVQACFAYIMHVASKNSVYDRFLCTQHPFLQYAVNCWPFHVQYVDLHPISKPLRTILSEFLQYDSSAWHLWVAIGHSEIQEQIDTRWMTTRWQRPLVERCLIHPLTWVSAAGLFNTLEFLTQDLSIKNIPATPHFGNPLHAAAMNGQYRIVELLISRGMDVNECSGKYGNPLQSACVARYVGNISIVRLLLERGAQVNARGGAFFTALQAASFTSQDPSIVHLLLLNGADVNIQGGLIGSALAAAACHGDKEVVQMLLEAGANVNAEGGNRGSPIQAACSKNHPEILRMLLLHGANVNLNGQKQGIPIQIAAAKGNVDMVELLLKTEGLVIDTEQVERIFSILRMKIQWHIRKNKNLPRMDALKSILEMIELYVNRVGINSKESLGIIIKEEIKTISS
jgi:ankyrin repeat protein